MRTMKAGQLAKELGISARTLREWERLLGVDSPRNELGHRVYDEEWIVYFKNVARLQLDEGCDWDEIQVLAPYPGQAHRQSERVSYQQLPLLVY